MYLTPFGVNLKKTETASSRQKQADAGQAITATEEAFEELFGKELAIHAKPLYLKNRTITVTCTSSALAQEIRLNQTKIVKKINKLLKSDEVDRIRYLS